MVKLFNKSANFETIEFGKPLKGGDGKYFISSSYVNDEETHDIICQFGPDLVLGSEFTEESTSLDVKLNNEKCLEFIKECDDQFLNLAKENKDSWFPEQNITDTYLENAFMASTKTIKKQTSFKMRTGPTVGIFSCNKEQLSPKDISTSDQISVIVQIYGLWFTKTRFGLTWMVKQIKKNKEIKDKVGESLFNDDEEEVEKLGNVFPDE